jgi:mannose PTS system EIIA component
MSPPPVPGTIMIGLIIVTHGNLAREFVAALEHVVGAQQQIATVSIAPHDDMEERREAILAAVAKVESGDGVIILTDMFGGTPSNLAISVMDAGSVEVIAGVNLPMLVKLARVREEVTLTDALKQAQEAGRKYIHVASLVLNPHS